MHDIVRVLFCVEEYFVSMSSNPDPYGMREVCGLCHLLKCSHRAVVVSSTIIGTSNRGVRSCNG